MKRILIVLVVVSSLLSIPALAVAEESASTATEVVALYQQMQAALAADSTDGVVAAAAAIAEKAKPCECGAEDAAAYEAVAAAAGKVDGQDLPTLREQFKGLSRAVAELLAGAGAKGSQVYFCPMAKGYWLQPASDTAPRNPYLGLSMPGCGTKVDKVAS